MISSGLFDCPVLLECVFVVCVSVRSNGFDPKFFQYLNMMGV